MPSPLTQSHKAKMQLVLQLCTEAADYSDSRIQGYLVKYLIIMASSYIEVCMKE